MKSTKRLRATVVILLVSALASGTAWANSKLEANEKKEAVGMGRYLEERVKIEGVDEEENPSSSFFKNKNGGIEMLSRMHAEEGVSTTYECFAPSQDGIWKKTDETLSKSINEQKFVYADGIVKDPKTGKDYLVGDYEISKAEYVPYIALVKEDSTLEPLSLKWKSPDEYSSKLLVGNGMLYRLVKGTIQQYNLETAELVREMGEDVTSMGLLKDCLYVTSRKSKSALECYDVNTGKELSSIKTDACEYTNEMVPAEDEKGLYIMNSKGIYYLAENSQLIEQVLDAASYKLAMSEGTVGWVNNACVCGGAFYIQILGNDGYVLTSFSYHKDVPSVTENQITVMSLEKCPDLERAARIYMDKHPDTSIDFKVINTDLEPVSGKAKGELLKKINTQILSGDVPDVMILDDLPLETYREKGLLGDMSSIVGDIKQSGDCYNNLIDTYSADGKNYAMPLRFDLFSAVGEKRLLENGFSLEKLAEYQMQHKDEQVLGNIVPPDLMKIMSGFWNERIITTDGKVDSEALTTFLKDINTLAPMRQGMKDYYYDRNCQRGDRVCQAKNKEIKSTIEKVENPGELQIAMYAKELINGGAIASSIEGDKNIVSLNQVVGISSKTDKLGMIKELLDIAVSKEVASKQFAEFSVNKKVNESAIVGDLGGKIIGSNRRWKLKDEPASFMNAKGEVINLPKWYTQEPAEYLNVLKDAKAVKAMDPMILDIIQKESEGYFNNQKSLDETVQTIKGKVEAYLSE